MESINLADTNNKRQEPFQIPFCRPDYGKALRKIRRILDMDSPQAAHTLAITQEELRKIELEASWTDEQIKYVSQKLRIPLAGIDYLATEADPLYFIVKNNTLGDGGMIGFNNYRHTYNSSTEGLTERMEVLINKLILEIGLLKDLVDSNRK